ncbi:MAG: AsmA family protein [Nitrosomonadales bacterium]|nr:AsmA family protein [Nitrosomonadales bacterium]
MKAIKNSALGLFGIIGVAVSMFGIKVPFAESFAKEHWRSGLAALLLIILMIPAGVGLFLYWVDANRFKAEIIQFVKVQTQRDLVLQGDLKVTFFPKLGLDSGKMSLSQRNSAKEFASINNARLYLAWLPLLKKQLVLERVEFDGVHANVVRYKDGTTNFDDLLIRNQTLSPVTLDIDGVRITNSSLNWQDEVKWKRVALQDIQVETGRLADTVPSQMSANFHLNAEIIHGDANVELKSRLFYDRKAGRYEFADIDGKLEGTVAGFSNLALNFKGTLDSQPSPAGQGSLLAENVAVSGTGNYGQRGIDVRLGAAKLQFTDGNVGGSQLALSTAWSQFDEKWTATMQMPTFEFANNIFNAADMGADFSFTAEGRALQGKLSGPVNIDWATAPKLRLAALALEVSAKHPVLSGELAAKATGSLQADFAERNASLDFNAKIDDSEIAGALALNDFSHPAYTFDLNANRLDLDRYIAADWIKRYQNDATQLDFSGIKNLALSGHLRAGEFKVSRLKATRLAADIRVEQAVLAIAPLTARLYGGALTASINVAAQGVPQISFKQNLRGVHAHELLADTAGAGRLAGRGDMAMEIGAEGGTVGALRKSLNGDISLVLAGGALSGIDMRAALLEGKDHLGVGGEPRVHEARFSERTDFAELKAALNIKDGISHGNSFDLRSPLFRVAGEGDLALDTGRLNYRLAATVAAALKRRSAGDLAELKGVSVPVSVSGTYASPVIALSFAGASGDVVNKRIAAQAEAAQAAAKAAEQAVAQAKHGASTKKPAIKANKK